MRRFGWLALLGLWVGLVGLGQCAAPNETSGGSPKAEEGSPQKDGSAADKTSDEKSAEAGAKKPVADDKQKKLNQLLMQRVRSREQAVETTKNVVAAAEELLADPDATDAQKKEAQAKLLMGLTQGISLGIDGYDGKLRTLVAEVTKSEPKGKLAAQGAAMLFRLDRLGKDAKIDESTVDAALEYFKSFPDHTDNGLGLLMMVGNRAESEQNTALARRAYQSIEGLTKDDPKGKLAAVGAAALFRLDHLGRDAKIDGSTVDAAVAYAERFADQPDNSVSLLMMIGNRAESEEKTDVAKRAYQTIQAKFPTQRAARRIEGMLRTLEMVGKEFPIELTLVNGTPLDPQSLKGKVVVVDFWATWCGPCVGEIPNMKRLYDEFHGQGFEIVGVSFDTDKAKLETFVQEKEIPWIQTYPEEGEPTGWDHPLSMKYGINSIPRVFLIDREGKLVSTKLRAKTLEDKVREMMGGGSAKPTEGASPGSTPKS